MRLGKRLCFSLFWPDPAGYSSLKITGIISKGWCRLIMWLTDISRMSITYRENLSLPSHWRILKWLGVLVDKFVWIGRTSEYRHQWLRKSESWDRKTEIRSHMNFKRLRAWLWISWKPVVKLWTWFYNGQIHTSQFTQRLRDKEAKKTQWNTNLFSKRMGELACW